jgi:hypothetical protein
VPRLLCHGTSVFQVSSEWQPHLVASYDTHEDMECLFSLTTHMKIWSVYSNPDRILTGPHSVASYNMQGDAKGIL